MGGLFISNCLTTFPKEESKAVLCCGGGEPEEPKTNWGLAFPNKGPVGASDTGGQEAVDTGPTEYNYIPPPKNITGIPDLSPARPKTPVQGGGGLRKRWKDKKGNIFEWDSQHGTLEKYNKRGKHQGEFNPETGEQTKPADKTRKVEP